LTSDKWLALDPEKLLCNSLIQKIKKLLSYGETKSVLEMNHINRNLKIIFGILELDLADRILKFFYDRGEKFNHLSKDDPENYPGGENERWLEIWNLVFF